MTKDESPNQACNELIKFLVPLAEGAVIPDLVNEIHDVVRAVRETGRAGDIANVEVLLNASHLAPETREIWLRKAALKIAENKAKSIAEIENDADRQRAIDLEVESYAIACEGNSADIGTKFLTKTDAEKLHSYYLRLSKENESKNAKKYRESVDERIAAIMESNGNERKLRVDAFDKFLDECGYLNAQDRFEARGKLEKLVAAEKARNEKAKSDALKLRNLNFKKRTQELFAGNTNIGSDELSSIAYIGNAAKSAFSAPDKDENGKITVSVAEKQQSYIEKLQDAIDSYDADADETGVYGRALLYQLDAVFTDDKTQNGKIYAPESERRLRRELGERLGIYPAANIKVESVKEYVSPIFDGVVGKSFSKLKFGQKQVYTQLKQAFIRTAMTAGLNDARELGEWVNKSPYVATLKERLKLLKGVEDASGFDTDFAYIENRTAKAPNLLGYAMGDMGISYMENAYLKMKNKRDEELSKKENTNGKQ